MADTHETTGKQILGRVLLRGLAGLVIAVTLLYFADFGFLRYRVATNRSAFGTVTVHPYYAIDRKDKKTEYDYEDPRDVTCVNSLFSHLGDPPCWYLRKHTDLPE